MTRPGMVMCRAVGLARSVDVWHASETQHVMREMLHRLGQNCRVGRSRRAADSQRGSDGTEPDAPASREPEHAGGGTSGLLRVRSAARWRRSGRRPDIRPEHGERILLTCQLSLRPGSGQGTEKLIEAWIGRAARTGEVRGH